jgi:aspartate carbamoyltransferase catalytic subunit
MNDFFQKDIISVRDLDKAKFEKIFSATDKIIKIDPSERRELGRGKNTRVSVF